jgi:hypothetical protein
MKTFSELRKQINENSLYTSQQEKDDFLKDKKNIVNAFLYSFIGNLSLYNKDPAKAKHYFVGDKKLQIQNITDDNNDASLILKIMHDEGGFKNSNTANNLTKLLAKLKVSDVTLDDTLMRSWLADISPSFHSVIPTELKKTVDDYTHGITSFDRLSYKLYKHKTAYGDGEYLALAKKVGRIDRHTHKPKVVSQTQPAPTVTPVTPTISNPQIVVPVVNTTTVTSITPPDVVDEPVVLEPQPEVKQFNQELYDRVLKKTKYLSTSYLVQLDESDVKELVEDSEVLMKLMEDYPRFFGDSLNPYQFEMARDYIMKNYTEESIIKLGKNKENSIWIKYDIKQSIKILNKRNIDATKVYDAMIIAPYICDKDIGISGQQILDFYEKNKILISPDNGNKIARDFPEILVDAVKLTIKDMGVGYVSTMAVKLNEQQIDDAFPIDNKLLAPLNVILTGRLYKDSSELLKKYNNNEVLIIQALTDTSTPHFTPYINSLNKLFFEDMDKWYPWERKYNYMKQLLTKPNAIDYFNDKFKYAFTDDGVFDYFSDKERLDGISSSLFDLMVTNYKTKSDIVDSLFNDLGDKIKSKVKKNFDSTFKVMHDLKNSALPIKEDLDAKGIKKILEFNGIDLSVISGNKMKFSKNKSLSQSINEYMKDGTNIIEPLKIVELKTTEAENKKVTEKIVNETHSGGRHGDIYPLILRQFEVHLPDVQFQEFKELMIKNNTHSEIIPAFHGTGSIAANMILRYGFKVIPENDNSGIGVAGRMLGDGIYFGTNIDKVLQYVGNAGMTRRLGTTGYVFEMENELGVQGEDYTSAGLGGDRIVSPEWCVYNANKQLKIIKAYEVKLVDRAELDKTLNEATNNRMMSFKEFNNAKKNNYTSYNFYDRNVITPDGKIIKSSDVNDKTFKKGIRVEIRGKITSIIIPTRQLEFNDILSCYDLQDNALNKYLKLVN